MGNTKSSEWREQSEGSRPPEDGPMADQQTQTKTKEETSQQQRAHLYERYNEENRDGRPSQTKHSLGYEPNASLHVSDRPKLRILSA
ncbi:hypothetical protein MPTK1_5g21670 [Marchantia polymorpha subsp. ruderalis]|uniref:Uncharacterized protein n=2 Tax=Marchantia polymorpha TaxID=3197 RepID=A0AAF6BKV1_MARPO|nr:hypothetical protein MARPO_0106s0032 [Marchantia polymorpha]PTQ31840.1 hypothetical protein MARPO_0106s0032 [Marchantia polymorpha]BBN12634.1 hypothetical protein Mp_5g21670 [Marchantia polymorpha subsp. ruderalis]BBN12635.1 hypothetical protein Mp_5g21670 [Marchantia polymorpha subsp. ruderalis]|eukprot:PTQ31836.1 hypothetical protein MARPO_0106s0032 [Marchantia polymorpha]